MPKFAVILPAAGKSSRFNDRHYKKPFAMLNDRAVWLHAADKFLNRDDVQQTIVVISPEDRERFLTMFGANLAIMGIEVVDGGAERSDSVKNGLARIRPDIEYVAIHDAARPCVASVWIDEVFAAAVRTGAAILATPVVGTLKRANKDGTILETVPRQDLWEAQTPQVFRRQILTDAYAKFGSESATDDAELVQRLGVPVSIVNGSPINLKITTKDDLRLAAQAIKAMPKANLLGPTQPFADDQLWR